MGYKVEKKDEHTSGFDNIDVFSILKPRMDDTPKREEADKYFMSEVNDIVNENFWDLLSPEDATKEGHLTGINCTENISPQKIDLNDIKSVPLISTIFCSNDNLPDMSKCYNVSNDINKNRKGGVD